MPCHIYSTVSLIVIILQYYFYLLYAEYRKPPHRCGASIRPQNGRRGYCAKYIQLIQSVPIGRKSCMHTLLEYSVQYLHTGATFCPYTGWFSCMYIFGAISNSSILWAYLYIYNSFSYMAQRIDVVWQPLV